MKLWISLILAMALTACSQAYYSVWETLGKEKRDLLRDNVQEVREDQADAQEQFKDALTRLRELQNFQDGDLAKLYDDLQEEYDDSVEKADQVRSRIDTVEDIAGDLFREWEQELEEISNAEFRADSRRKLQRTRERYNELHQAMMRAENSMEPVLTSFKDHVLYLKHNLNAQAIAGLQAEVTGIEDEVGQLIRAMQASIEEADAFIATLE